MRKALARDWNSLLLVLSWVSLSALPATSQGRPQYAPVLRPGGTVTLRNVPPLPPPIDQLVIPHRGVLGSSGPQQTDPVVQSTTSAPAIATTAGPGFEGVGNGVYGYTVKAVPPDTNGTPGGPYTDAAGLHSGQYVQWVNLAFAVFDKDSGVLLYGPAAGNTIWQGSGLTDCEQTNDGDPIAQYDHFANVWVMTQLTYSLAPPYGLCVAVSQTSDARGTWNRYELQWSNTLPDYPKVGIWPDGYYMTFNLFFGEFLFVGGQACALDRNILINNLNPQPNSLQCFTLSSYPSLLPADADGPAPPAGRPNFIMNRGSNSLNLWKFHVDFVNAGNTTLTGPTNIPVASFSAACGGGTCIPQAGTSQQLDSLADRLMYRLAYRNFGDHESLVVNHSVNPSGGGRKSSGGSSAIRWYEIRNPNGTPQVFQQGTFAPDSNFRWMGSIAMDKVGDIAVGYSVSSAAMSPAIRYTGRVPTDALGTLEAESTIIQGAGSQTQVSRWGDYSSMRVDPVDDCTFWYTNEYIPTNGSYNWHTYIARFKFPSCQ